MVADTRDDGSGSAALAEAPPTRRSWRWGVLALAVTTVLSVGVGAQVATAGEWAPSVLHPSALPTAVPESLPPVPDWRVVQTRRGPGYAGVTRWVVPTISRAQSEPIADRQPTDRTAGVVGSVVIPATRSHFRARPALVYLPPAALTSRPARLPVVVLFSGQSRGAGPMDLIRQGHLAAMMDRIALANHGLAPIVVVPDQLGPGSPNPMCVDSALGHVATYVTRDVRAWILRHLPVQTDRRAWTVAGFSEGGTCSIQFASGYPKIFGSFVDVSGELAPTNGTLAHTIAVGFGASRSRYTAATPLRLLAAHRPFVDTRGYFAVGALDPDYGPVAPKMVDAATAAGIRTTFWKVPGLRHNWHVGSAGLA